MKTFATSQHSPSKPVRIFPAVAEIMRCPSEMSSGGVMLGVGTAPVDAVDVIGKGPSSLDVHGVESRSGSKTSPEALEWLEVAEISSPIDIKSVKTGSTGCVDAGLVLRLLGLRLASLAEKRCVTRWKIFGVSRVAAGGDKRAFVNALDFLYTVPFEQPISINQHTSMATSVILV